MIKLGTAEGSRGVTGFTSQLGRNMLRSLDHIVLRQTQTTGMATIAIAWRAFEQTIDVARLAPGRAVHPGQRKARLQMVEVARHGLRQRRSTPSQEQHQRPYSDGV